MNFETSSGTRCARHPSRTFTGFCPVCLSERLARVDKAERVVLKRSSYGLPGDDGRGTLSPPGAADGFEEEDKKHSPPPPPEVKVRKTLKLLFQMNDDDNKKTSIFAEVVVPFRASSKHLGDFVAAGFHDGIPHVTDEIKDPAFPTSGNEAAGQAEICAEQVSSRMSESRIDSDAKASSTSCSTTVGNSSSETYRDSNARDGSTMSRGSSSSSTSHWLGSALVSKSAKWSFTSVLRRCSSVHETTGQQDICSRGEKQSDTNSSTRRSSCDWNLCSGSRKNSCDDPRHSWDSSVVGRAFMCSFTCLEEKENVNPAEEERNRDATESNFTNSGRESGYVHDEAVSVGGDACRNHAATKASKHLKDMLVEDRHHTTILPCVSKRMSNRWSKVWNWSISSPFRDFSTKGRALDRSMSGSWKERHPAGKMEADKGSNLAASSRVAAAAAASSNRRRYFGSGGRQSMRIDRPRSKMDGRFGRSHSVHYSSPGNFDNGLLRFYLTPLRNTNRNLARGRSSSRSFTRGIFGLF